MERRGAGRQRERRKGPSIMVLSWEGTDHTYRPKRERSVSLRPTEERCAL